MEIKLPRPKEPEYDPSYLVAPPTLFDPFFQNAVILLASHKGDGAMGFNIAKRTNLRFYEMLQNLSIIPKVPDRQVLLGGPVSKNSGFILYEHAKNNPLGAGIPITNRLSISPTREILEAAAHGMLPGRFELIIGYAGWGPGKLEEEFKKGVWLHTHFYNEMIFETSLEDRWQRAYARLGVSPVGFINVPGGAQA